MNIEFNKIRNLVKRGYINVQKHPDAHLYVYKYSLSTQFERNWTNETMAARGLILDREGNVVARPFAKFFNYQEPEAPELTGDYKIYSKLDGSLGTLYWLNDKPYIASAGSFTSPQAQRGTDMLYENHSDSFDKLDRTKTYVFEIIYPSNRIVVDYGAKSDLTLLGVVDNETGADLGFPEGVEDLGFPLVEEIPYIPPKKLKALDIPNEEGYVIRFPNGDRSKVKFNEYKQLHLVVTETSNLSLWRSLKDRRPIDHVFENVPDEFYNWANDTVNNLLVEFNEVYSLVRKEAAFILKEAGFRDNRKMKEAANKIEDRKIAGLALSVANRADSYVDQFIWDMIRPSHEKPFENSKYETKSKITL